MSWKSISKDAWYLICLNINVKDILNLRQTCKTLNHIIKNLNQYWYKCYKFYLAYHGQEEKSECCQSVHIPYYICRSCVDDYVYKTLKEKYTNEYLFITRHTPHDSYVRHRFIEKLEKEGKFNINCNYKNHYRWIKPKSIKDVPFTKEFHDTNNLFIYHFLIENYRNLHKKTKNKNVNIIKGNIERKQRKISDLQEDLKLLQNELSLSNTCKINKIFYNKRKRAYKGV